MHQSPACNGTASLRATQASTMTQTPCKGSGPVASLQAGSKPQNWPARHALPHAVALHHVVTSSLTRRLHSKRCRQIAHHYWARYVHGKPKQGPSQSPRSNASRHVSAHFQTQQMPDATYKPGCFKIPFMHQWWQDRCASLQPPVCRIHKEQVPAILAHPSITGNTFSSVRSCSSLVQVLPL